MAPMPGTLPSAGENLKGSELMSARAPLGRWGFEDVCPSVCSVFEKSSTVRSSSATQYRLVPAGPARDSVSALPNYDKLRACSPALWSAARAPSCFRFGLPAQTHRLKLLPDTDGVDLEVRQARASAGHGGVHPGYRAGSLGHIWGGKAT